MTYLKYKTDFKEGSNNSYEIKTFFFQQRDEKTIAPKVKNLFQFFKYLPGIDDLGEHTGLEHHLGQISVGRNNQQED